MISPFALRLLGFAGVLGVELIKVVPEVAEAADAGREGAEALDLCDDDGERGEHRGEGSPGLGDDAEFHRAAHEHRADDETGNDEGEIVVAVGEEAEVPRPTDDPESVFQHRVEALDEVAMFALFSAEEGDGFRGVAHADEAVSEGRFLLILVEIQAHEAPPKEHGDAGADRGIDEEDADELARDSPQNAQETDEGHEGVDDDEEEIQDARGEEFHVLRDTLIRVVH